MRLRKRIGAAILAVSMAFTIFPAGLSFATEIKAAETEEIKETENATKEVLSKEELKATTEKVENVTQGALSDLELLSDESIKEEGKETKAAEDQNDIKITNVTIADTYYNIGEKFPLYVEYTTENELSYEQRRKLKLKVTMNNGEVSIAEGISDNGSFSIEECNNIKNGDECNLEFSIVYINDEEKEEEVWSKTKLVKFENKDAWASCAYLPAQKQSYNITLYVSTGAAMNAEQNTIDGIYLVDKDNKIAVGTSENIFNYINSYNDIRYGNTFKESFGFYNWRYCSINSYDLCRTRKLQDKEILRAAYSVKGEMHYLNDVIFTVTEQPYITDIYRNSSYYPEDEEACILQVSGCNIDFNKLSIALKDKITGEIVGNSVSSMTKPSLRDAALYTIKWNKNFQPITGSDYNVEYSYSDDKVKLINEMKSTITIYGSSSNIIWNPKTDSIEYYNKELPIGSEVYCEVKDQNSDTASCCASRSGIKVSNEHVITVPLKETFESTNTRYLYVTYKDKENQEKIITSSVFIYQNKQVQDSGSGSEDGNSYVIYPYIFNNRFYLSNDKKPEFSAGLFCNDVNKLKNTCSGTIYNITKNEIVGNVNLTFNDKTNQLSYQGTYEKTLKPGRYRLSFMPDGNNNLNYDFYVEDSERLSVQFQYNNIVSGYIQMTFGANNIAEWYCNEENLKKLKVKLFDIQKKEIGTYQFSKDFIVTGSGNYRNIQFNDTIKKELVNRYFCYVYIYYDDKEIAVSFNFSSTIESLYEYQKSYAKYKYSEDNNSSIYMSYRSSDLNVNGKTTYDRVNGSESAFPAVVKITDWYSLKTVKEITVPKTGYQFTEEDLKDLSPTKVYRFFLNGKDGTVSSGYEGYIDFMYGDQFFTKFSKVYPVSGDFDVIFEFTNKSKGIYNWENYLVCFANVFEQIVPKLNDNPGYKEYYVLRADAYGWSVGSTGTTANKTLEGNDVTYEYDWEWDQFLNMIKDSRITMNIKRVGNDFTVDAKIKGADNKDYTYKVMFTTVADKDMTIFFSNENADVSILSFTDNTNKKPETPDDSNNNNNNNNTYIPPSNTGGSSIGGSTTPVKEEQPKQEEPKQEEKQPEDNKDTEQEKPPVKEPEDTENTDMNQQGNNTSSKNTKGKLTLKKKKITLKKGQKSKIKITSKLNTKVTYKSLNKSVATVSKKGVVTAKKVGKATITVKANGKTKKVKVTVKKTTGKNSSVIKLGRNFKLSEKKTVLKKGNKLTIQAASSISGKVTYRSLNKKIASVSVKGVVKAKKKGKTAIVIKAGKKTIKLKVTVQR